MIPTDYYRSSRGKLERQKSDVVDEDGEESSQRVRSVLLFTLGTLEWEASSKAENDAQVAIEPFVLRRRRCAHQQMCR